MAEMFLSLVLLILILSCGWLIKSSLFRCAEAAMPQSPSNLEAVVGTGTGAGVVEVELVEEGLLSASLFLMASDVLSMMFAKIPNPIMNRMPHPNFLPRLDLGGCCTKTGAVYVWAAGCPQWGQTGRLLLISFPHLEQYMVVSVVWCLHG